MTEEQRNRLDNITIADWQRAKGVWEEHLKYLQDHHDELLELIQEARKKFWTVWKVKIMLYNNQNEIEECEENIKHIDRFIQEDLEL